MIATSTLVLLSLHLHPEMIVEANFKNVLTIKTHLLQQLSNCLANYLLVELLRCLEKVPAIRPQQSLL